VEVAAPQGGLDTKINFTVIVSVLLNIAAYGPLDRPCAERLLQANINPATKEKES
jgi:hypothetical protein